MALSGYSSTVDRRWGSEKTTFGTDLEFTGICVRISRSYEIPGDSLKSFRGSAPYRTGFTSAGVPCVINMGKQGSKSLIPERNTS